MSISLTTSEALQVDYQLSFCTKKDDTVDNYRGGQPSGGHPMTLFLIRCALSFLQNSRCIRSKMGQDKLKGLADASRYL